MHVGAAKEVSAGAVGHQRCRILTAVQQPWTGRKALLDLVRLDTVDRGHRGARNARNALVIAGL